MVCAALDILFDDNYGLQSKKVWNGICLTKSGSAVKLIEKLEEKMYQHARDLEFEDAARVRDQIEKIRASALIS